MMNRFKEQRMRHNISIEKLSQMSGIAVDEIIAIEENKDVGEVSAVKTAYIAEAIGCLPSELIYGDSVI